METWMKSHVERPLRRAMTLGRGKQDKAPSIALKPSHWPNPPEPTQLWEPIGTVHAGGPPGQKAGWTKVTSAKTPCHGHTWRLPQPKPFLLTKGTEASVSMSPLSVSVLIILTLLILYLSFSCGPSCVFLVPTLDLGSDSSGDTEIEMSRDVRHPEFKGWVCCSPAV